MNRLRNELNFLDETDCFAMMQYNIKVLALLGPGEHWLLRRITTEDLERSTHARSMVTGGTIDEILGRFKPSGNL